MGQSSNDGDEDHGIHPFAVVQAIESGRVDSGQKHLKVFTFRGENCTSLFGTDKTIQSPVVPSYSVWDPQQFQKSTESAEEIQYWKFWRRDTFSFLGRSCVRPGGSTDKHSLIEKRDSHVTEGVVKWEQSRV